MERIIDRVNDFIQYKGMSIRAFESEAGIKYSSISAAIKRGTELNTATLLKIIVIIFGCIDFYLYFCKTIRGMM